MGGKDGVDVSGVQESPEEGVADLACGLFDSLAAFGDAGGDVGAMDVERNIELETEVLDEVEIGIRFGGFAYAVVNVGGGEADSESVTRGSVRFVQREQQGDGVGAAGDGYADTVTRVNVFTAEGKWRECGHELPS